MTTPATPPATPFHQLAGTARDGTNQLRSSTPRNATPRDTPQFDGTGRDGTARGDVAQPPRLFADLAAYTLPPTPLPSVQSLAAQLSRMAAVYHQVFTPTDRHATAPASAQSDFPALQVELTGRDVLTLSTQFAELSTETLAATVTAWRTAADTLRQSANNAAQGWGEILHELARRAANITQRVEGFQRVYTNTRTQLAEIIAHREEAQQQPAFQTYTFPESAFTSCANHVLATVYNPGLQAADISSFAFSLPQRHQSAPATSTTSTVTSKVNAPTATTRNTVGTSGFASTKGHGKTLPPAAPARTPSGGSAAWPVPREYAAESYTPDISNPVYNPQMREAYQKLFGDHRTPDLPVSDSPTPTPKHRPHGDPHPHRGSAPDANRVLPKPGRIHGPIRHPDDPLYGSGR